MKTASILRALVVVLLVATCIAVVAYDAGAARATRRDADSVTAAKIEAAFATAQSQLLSGTLTDVNARLAVSAAQLRNKQAEAVQAMLDRDTAQQQLALLAMQRTQNVMKVGHEDPECSDLAGLPVCPAVAQRLWGEAYGPQAPPGGGAQGR